MPLIEYVEQADATGRVQELLEQSADRHGKTSLLLAILAHSPPVLEAWHHYYSGVMLQGDLDEELKQLAHVTVSITNECAYCAASHTENLVESFDVPHQHVERIASGDIDGFPPRQRAVIEFAETATKTPNRVRPDDVQSLYDVGFDDAAVVELLATVALANAANTVTASMNVLPADRDEVLPEYSPE